MHCDQHRGTTTCPSTFQVSASDRNTPANRCFLQFTNLDEVNAGEALNTGSLHPTSTPTRPVDTASQYPASTQFTSAPVEPPFSHPATTGSFSVMAVNQAAPDRVATKDGQRDGADQLIRSVP